MKEFIDKVAVITGAASGIGRSIAKKFLQEGIKVVLADIEKDILSQTEKELKRIGPEVISIVSDVSKVHDIRTLAQTTINNFGAVHILVNNAGVGFAGQYTTTIWESPLSEWQWIIGVNLWGVIHGIHVFTPIMLSQDTECIIINTCSMAGLFSPKPGANIYSITKHAVVALTESLRNELAPYSQKIKVFALCPGFISTKITESDRNRPKELVDEIETNPKLKPFIKAYQDTISKGISPDKVAEILFHSLKSDKFYIATDQHRFIRTEVKKRMEEILRDFEK